MVDVDEVVVDDSVELSLFSSEDFRQVLVPFGSIFGARFPPFLFPCQTSTSSPVSLSLVTTLPCSVGDESLERDPLEVDPVEDLKSSGLGRETGGKVLIPWISWRRPRIFSKVASMSVRVPLEDGEEADGVLLSGVRLVVLTKGDVVRRPGGTYFPGLGAEFDVGAVGRIFDLDEVSTGFDIRGKEEVENEERGRSRSK
jgi:hypothetical protein